MDLITLLRVCVGMTGGQLWGPEDDMPDLVSDNSEEEEAAVNRQPRPARPDAEALLTLGVRAEPPSPPAQLWDQLALFSASYQVIVSTTLL